MGSFINNQIILDHKMAPNDMKEVLQQLTKVLCRGSETEEVTLETGTLPDGKVVTQLKRVPIGDYTQIPGDGSILYWKDKFKREAAEDFPPFKPGEHVVVSGFVEPDPKGLYKIHVDADGRIADNFFVAKVPEPDPLVDSLGMSLELLLEVGEERKEDGRISDIWNYDAKLAGIISRPQINLETKDLEGLQSGKRVTVQGEFVGFLGQPEGEWYDKYNSGIVKTENGKEIYLDFPTGKITFSGGVLENLVHQDPRKHPEIGDKIKIAAFITRAKREPKVMVEGTDPGVRLAAHWCDPCYLDEPCESRQKKYDLLRSVVDSKVKKVRQYLSKKKYFQARFLIGNLRLSELTVDEIKITRDLVSEMPEKEKPLQIPISDNNPSGKVDPWTKNICKAYKINIEAMTKKGFVYFAREAVTGRLVQTGKKADTSYLYGIAARVGIDKETRESLLLDCIETRWPKIRGNIYNHDIDWDDKYNTEQAFTYLAGLGTKNSAQQMFQYLRSVVEQEEFHEIGWREKQGKHPETFLYPVVSAINACSDEMPSEILIEELPYLRGLVGYLNKHADEPIAVGQIERTIDYIDDLGNHN